MYNTLASHKHASHTCTHARTHTHTHTHTHKADTEAAVPVEMLNTLSGLPKEFRHLCIWSYAIAYTGCFDISVIQVL